MNAENLAASARKDEHAPDGLTPELHAMWLAKKGRWDEAHDLCQRIPGSSGAWVHAWLHRQEGDIVNAGWWYSKAGKSSPPADVSLDDEWLAIVRALQ